MSHGTVAANKEETAEAVNTALDVALIVMRNGGSTSAAERSFTDILKAYKQQGVSAVWRLDFIAATSAAEGPSSTFLRPVGPTGVHLLRVSEAGDLAERAARGDVSTNALAAEVERINNLPALRNRWVIVMTAAGTAACFSQIPGGDWGSFGIAFVAAGIGQFFRCILQAKNLAVIPLTVICGVLSATIASIALRLGYSQMAPITLVASVMYMFPGLPLIDGFLDVTTHKHLLVGMERILKAAFLVLVLAAAIGLADFVILQ